MKKSVFLIPLLLLGQQALAVNSQDEENYKLHYAEQVQPLVMKKLSSDRPEMGAKALKTEATAYVQKMAGCQLEGLKQFPQSYQDMAILPVANGEDIGSTTQALNKQIKKDVEDGKISEDKVKTMIQSAQETVQVCANS
jgi:hypothetical protein